MPPSTSATPDALALLMRTVGRWFCSAAFRSGATLIGGNNAIDDPTLTDHLIL